MPAIHENFEVHDHFQFELKLEYWLAQSRRDNYQVDMYLFLPIALGLDHHSYPRDAFYDDVKNHVRLKTPELPLDRIAALDTGCPGNLLNKAVTDLLEQRRKTPAAADTDSAQTVEYHAKMYVSIAVRALQNRADTCRDELARGITSSTWTLSGEIDRILSLLQAMADKVAREPTTDQPIDRLTTIMTSADEYLTSVANQALLGILAAINSGGAASVDPADREALRTALLIAVRQQSHYRAERGFPALDPDSTDQDETVLFRLGVFKKFFRSALFITQHRQTDGRLISQITMGLAAGLAMAFATVVAFLAQRHFGNFTMPLFAALVVGYVFKDRIKELTRVYLDKRLSRSLYDSKTHFFNTDGYRMGICRELVRFNTADEIPADVRRLRNKDHLTEIANFWQAEKIIHYRKHVSLFRAPLRQTNPGYETTAVNDIIRYNVHRLLRNMDEPEKGLLCLREDDSVGTVTGARIYKVSLVLRLKGRTGEQLVRFRLILDRNGIRRLETVTNDSDS